MIILTLIFLLLDIVSKVLVSKYIVLEKSIKIINDFFYITYVRNTGVAWSMFSSKTILVLLVSSFIILGIILYIYNNRPKNMFEKLAYSMILGGAIGNFVDRIIYGYVIDFIDIKIFGYDYPIFNLADSFIVIGVILLVIYTWRCNNGNKGNRK